MNAKTVEVYLAPSSITVNEHLAREARAIKEEAEKIIVIDKSTCEKAAEIYKKAKTVSEGIYERQVRYRQYTKAEYGELRKREKKVRDPCDAAMKIVKRKLKKYFMEAEGMCVQ